MPSQAALAVSWEGGQGPPAIFVHANGFVPAVYQSFLDRLSSKLSVQALATRSLQGFELPSSRFDWEDLGKELGAWLKGRPSLPVVGIGHSMGATALIYAAACVPQVFSALVLIEPASVSWWMDKFVRTMPFCVLKRFQPMRGAVQKRDHWPDREAFLASCLRSGMYARFDDTAMALMRRHAVAPRGDGVGLVYPRKWEAYNYAMVRDPIPALARVQVPVLLIRAEDSFFMDRARWSRFVRTPRVTWHSKIDNYGHLVPLEAPQVCAARVLEGLEQGSDVLDLDPSRE